MTEIFNQYIEILSPGKKSSVLSSVPVDDWDNPTVFVPGFLVSIQPARASQPAGSSEGPVERPAVSASWRLVTPPGTHLAQLSARSRVRTLTGMIMDVIGIPEQWPDPFNAGMVHHTEATLEVRRG